MAWSRRGGRGEELEERLQVLGKVAAAGLAMGGASGVKGWPVALGVEAAGRARGLTMRREAMQQAPARVVRDEGAEANGAGANVAEEGAEGMAWVGEVVPAGVADGAAAGAGGAAGQGRGREALGLLEGEEEGILGAEASQVRLGLKGWVGVCPEVAGVEVGAGAEEREVTSAVGWRAAP